jgi:enoyl-CoA hydratase/carnithine racemase
VTYQYLKTAVEEGVAVVALNHPPVNALSMALFGELAAAFEAVRTDPVARAIVLTAEGSVFAAGADIKEIARIADAAEGERLALEGHKLGRALEAFPKPILAAINGPCLGGGLELAMCCHLRIASDRARFAQPEIHIGIIPGLGGTQRLARIVGVAQALEMILTGDMISATQAKAIGLVNQVVPEAELRRAAVGLARKMAAHSLPVTAHVLRAVREGIELPLERALALEARLFGATMALADKKEGVAAFIEKRQPKFTDQ